MRIEGKEGVRVTAGYQADSLICVVSSFILNVQIEYESGAPQ